MSSTTRFREVRAGTRVVPADTEHPGTARAAIEGEPVAAPIQGERALDLGPLPGGLSLSDDRSDARARWKEESPDHRPAAFHAAGGGGHGAGAACGSRPRARPGSSPRARGLVLVRGPARGPLRGPDVRRLARLGRPRERRRLRRAFGPSGDRRAVRARRRPRQPDAVRPPRPAPDGVLLAARRPPHPLPDIDAAARHHLLGTHAEAADPPPRTRGEHLSQSAAPARRREPALGLLARHRLEQLLLGPARHRALGAAAPNDPRPRAAAVRQYATDGRGTIHMAFTRSHPREAPTGI